VRIIPRSLGAQLVVLMLGGFLLGAVIAALATWSQAGKLHPIAREHALSRAATAYRLAKHPLFDGDSWLDSFNGPLAHLWIDRVPSVIEMNDDERSLADAVRQRLGTQVVAVHMPCLDAQRWVTLQELDPGSQCVDISVPLGEGRWLHTRQALPIRMPWSDNWDELRISMLIGIPPVLILMYLFVNRILRPATALTDAVHRMSRGERLDPLTVQGPEELRQLANAFNQMHQRITRFVDERTRMLAAISHDLRTPLTGIELEAVMLPSSGQRTRILRMLEQIRGMVNETLTFAAQDARAERSEETDLVELLGEICDDRLALGRKVRFNSPTRLPYSCRTTALRRALDNLMENALRHGNHVVVELVDRGYDGLRIEISDDGPGIPEDMLERVFEPFFQMDESRHREAGSNVGLGLAIARDCIQAHGGDLSLHNGTNGGLIAKIDLPSQNYSYIDLSQSPQSNIKSR
jgi:signal transduction histidine kinase